MTELLLHPQSRRDIENVIQNPIQALLIIGKQGSGTDYAASHLAMELLGSTSLQNQPYYFEIGDEGTAISIEHIRELQQFLKLRVAGAAKPVNRVVIIKKAGRMGAEAQNALLKTLEEPPAGSMLILTAHSSEELLPTIVSRVRTAPILPVSSDDAWEYFKEKGISEASFKRSYALSGGGAGLLTALIHDEDNELVNAVALAKELLAQSVSSRLLRVEELAKDKAKLSLLLDGLYRICHAGLQASALKNADKAVQQWQVREKHVLEAFSSLKRNANTKLLLDNLFMHI